jgi:dolichol-phosphate mannosyltransferase
VRRGVLALVRAGALAVVVARLARAARTRPPIALRQGDGNPVGAISVVVPARDEAARIGPLLRAMIGAPDVAEVIVVDDQSDDDTAIVAAGLGATVVPGGPRPDGWAGKPWSLQQGVTAASGEWIVTLDADARPAPELPGAAVRRAIADRTDLLTLAGRFECPTPGARWLHAAMLTTLVYRFGPPGREPRPAPDRTMANGQCMVFRRDVLLADGGFAPVAGEVVEDVALARHLATAGRTVDFLDAAELLTVRMYESFADTWTGWGRSIALPGVEPRWRQLLDVVVIGLTMPLPLLRLISGRVDAIDAIALAARVGTLVGTRRAYDRADLAYWASPLGDAPAVAALAIGACRRTQTWRGRRYVVPPR